MDSEGFKRKLSAILSADVVGYSRLMGEDDDATVHTLTGHREGEPKTGLSSYQALPEAIA